YLDTRYGHLGSTMREIVATFLFNPAYWIGYITQPSKLEYVRDLLTPVLGLSLFAPLTLAVLSPTLALVLLSSSKLQNTLELEHYPAPMVPVVVISAIYGIAWLAPRVAKWLPGTPTQWVGVFAAIVAVASALYHHDRGLTPLRADWSMKPRTERHALADRLVAIVPPDAAVSATGALNAHLAARRSLHVYPTIADATWVVVDLAPSIAPIVNRDRHTHLMSLRAQGFGVVAAEDGYLILARGEPDRADPADAFRRVATTAPQTPLPATIGPLTLVGYDSAFEGRATASLTLYLQTDQPLAHDYRLFTVLLDSTGAPRPGTEAEVVAPIWFPTSQWSPGVVYVAETKRWTRKDAPDRFSVGLIATATGAVWDP
ncbi:MAG: DUF2079 domain-containing protein, partial [Dehalococcoidia bacterium]|nr:DUF2079 domain-containing protein [Dehalococcoidia bacterium]